MVVVPYLVQAFKVILHALDRHILPILDTLGLEHLRERPLAFLGNKAILCGGASAMALVQAHQRGCFQG
jgi:hypothetical protein